MGHKKLEHVNKLRPLLQIPDSVGALLEEEHKFREVHGVST